LTHTTYGAKTSNTISGEVNEMESDKSNILKLMELELEQRKKDVRRLEKAIAAYKGEETPTTRLKKPKTTTRKGVKWTSLILKLFGSDAQYTFDEICETLVQEGIPQAGEARGRSAINTTLSRLTGKGRLKKTADGKFRKTKPTGGFFGTKIADISSENKNSAENFKNIEDEIENL
jgi:hypothetical protein